MLHPFHPPFLLQQKITWNLHFLHRINWRATYCNMDGVTAASSSTNICHRWQSYILSILSYHFPRKTTEKKTVKHWQTKVKSKSEWRCRNIEEVKKRKTKFIYIAHNSCADMTKYVYNVILVMAAAMEAVTAAAAWLRHPTPLSKSLLYELQVHVNNVIFITSNCYSLPRLPIFLPAIAFILISFMA